MITFGQIMEESKPHGFNKDGKIFRYETDEIIVSVVGGRSGLYGDFDNTFEVALIEKNTGDFVSGKYFPEYSDSMGQVMAYLTKEQMLEVVNKFVV